MPRLDQSQQAFCDAKDGNIRLLAPAGCGKTHSLLHRSLAIKMRAPEKSVRFLIVTFTVAARDELRSRLNEQSVFAPIRDAADITTLNGWGFRRIKSQTRSPKLIVSKTDKHFAVMNQLQGIWTRHASINHAYEANRNTFSTSLLQLVDDFKSIGFDHTRHANFQGFESRVSGIDNEGLDWRYGDLVDRMIALEILATGKNRKGDERPTNKKVYDAFYKFWLEATAHLISNATFTLEDQKYVAYLDERQKADEEKALTGAARYDHVIVDEFQDINPLDLNLIKAIIDRHRASLTIVGDDDQAIYEWRGTTPSYILEPDQFFGRPFNTYTLGINYRSPANIVRLSQQLIGNNLRRVAKDTRPHSRANAVIDVCETLTINDALELAHRLVQEHLNDGKSPTRIALIGRKQAQLIPYQIYFASEEIPFCAAEDLQIFLSKTFDRLMEILDIKQQAGTNQRKRQVAMAMVKLCDLVKRYPLKKAEREGVEQYLTRSAGATLNESVDALAAFSGPLKGPNTGGAMSSDFAAALRAFFDAESVAETLYALSEHFDGLQADLGKAEDDIFYKDPPFAQLAEFAQRYGNDFGKFLDDIELAKEQLAHIPPVDDEAPNPNDVQKRPLHLMTALRAKGKEFDTVMLLDCVDGIWPNKNATTSMQLESERRVFYVAFTRARSKIVVQTCKRVGKRLAIASRYLGELGLDVESQRLIGR